MKVFLSIFCIALAATASAFDLTAWLERRDLMKIEAERLCAAYSNCNARANAGVPAKDVALPIETYESGAIKLSVRADSAMYFHKEGLVWAKGVVVEKLDRDGTIDTRLVADNCVIDRFTKSGWADGCVKLTHGKTSFEGRNAYFSSPEGYVSIGDHPDLSSSDLRFGGLSK